MVKTPDDLRYAESHEWVRVEGGVAVIGITDYAQDALTDVVFVELPEKGAKLEKGKTFGVVESVKSVSELYAPVSGEVVETNASLDDEPEKINDDAYGDGWMIKVKMASPGEVDRLLDAEAYKKRVAEGD